MRHWRGWMAAGAVLAVLGASGDVRAGFITGVTIHQVSSEFTASGWDLRAIHLVDGSGLVGAGHNQTIYPGGESWQTSTSSGTGMVAFDLGGLYDLDRVHVWNYNMYDPWYQRGAERVNISLSTDGSNWTSVGEYLFPIATGLDGDLGFDISASSWDPTRYVKFDILEAHGPNTSGHVGLSEVQFMVPEPSTLPLLGLSLLLLRRRRRA
ncbi:MAG: discoidin domain-containing protein [Lentisphaerae bacterium]|nr:discoidin domain-containing protein [Lentisphaerota bacterium]